MNYVYVSFYGDKRGMSIAVNLCYDRSCTMCIWVCIIKTKLDCVYVI